MLYFISFQGDGTDPRGKKSINSGIIDEHPLEWIINAWRFDKYKLISYQKIDPDDFDPDNLEYLISKLKVY